MGRNRNKKHLQVELKKSSHNPTTRPPELRLINKGKAQKAPNKNSIAPPKGSKIKTNAVLGQQPKTHEQLGSTSQGSCSVAAPFVPWVKPDHLSEKWNILQTRTDTDLTLMQWNVEGLGSKKIKRQDIQKTSCSLGADIIAITEHHKPHSKFVGEKDFFLVRKRWGK